MFDRHILQDEATAGDLVPASGGEPGASGGAGDGGGLPPAPRSALGSGAEFQEGQAAPTGDLRPEWCPDDNWNTETGAPFVPEKFWDKDLKGPNSKAMAKSYSEFEKRFGNAAELPPKESGEYKFEIKEGETWDVAPELEKEFQERAYTAGLNNRQYNAFIRDYTEGVTAAGNQAIQSYVDRMVVSTNEALLAQHGSKTAVQKVQGEAYRTFMRFATPQEQAQINELPDHPAIINVLARVAGLMKEDSPPNGGGSDGFVSLTTQADALYKDMKGPYWHEHHPGHMAAMQVHSAYMAECTRRGVDPLKNRLAKSA